MKNISTALLLFLGCTCFAQSQRQIENQMAFAKFYGYVRYFYPGDDAAKIDWDKFAIYGAQQVDQCKTDEALKENLNAMAQILMPGVSIVQGNEKIVFPANLKPKNLNGYQEITWQHLGVGLLNDKRSLYQSARTNRKTVFKNKFTGFGNLSTLLPAKDIKGKSFVLSGRGRMLSDDGQGQFWLRVDRENGQMGFFENMDSRPIRSKSWQNFEIKGTINEDAKQILLGAFLVNRGKFAIDDLILKVDGKEIYHRDFEDETVGSEPKTISVSTGRSSVENAKYVFAANVAQQNKFVEVASPTIVESESLDIKPFGRRAQFGEYIEKPISSNLKVFVPIVLYGTKTQTFPFTDSVKVNKQLSAINSLSADKLTVNNLYMRIGNITNTWNIF
ncbi:hypothetical protein [Pedobacter agri]|uniref:hypothetical protein n=1 Tax=Pedobacter agri TaxID=454586 RepID=UPI002931E9B9|nr:hypothetical protein [Pedobacter agri]